ncbi:MAG: hypothetical protein ACPGQS_06860 [Bradymonadia bacterium]
MNWSLATGRPCPNASPKAIARNTLDAQREQLNGTIVSLPGLPHELLSNQTRTVEQLESAAQICVDNGAQIIGLGGVAAMIGGQGKALARRISAPVTSGNHMTADTAFQTSLRLLSLVPPNRWRVAIIGLPSPVGILLVKLLARTGVDLEIVAPTLPEPTRKLLKQLTEDWKIEIETVPSVGVCKSRILIAASSTGANVPLSQIPSQTVVVDVAAPEDINHDHPRDDVIVVDGEYLSPPTPLKGSLWQSVYGYLTHQPDTLLACFVEPMLIAISGQTDLCGVGRNLCTDKASTLGRLAAQHGFLVDAFYRKGVPIGESAIERCLHP